MRIFKYWAEYTTNLNINGFKQESKAIGGSDFSVDAAKKEARLKLEKAQKIIDGNLKKDENYEVDIVEEIIDKIDDDNIVTRNRYGALVLNSKHLMFIDIDDYHPSFFETLFKRGKNRKALLLDKIKKTIQQKEFNRLGFRVYETFKGYRVIVTNKSFEPRSKASNKIMNTFKADWLYKYMCNRQNCYRARLTPKPYRIKQKGIKVVFPNRNSEEEQQMINWIVEYNNLSKNYATCKLVFTHGRVDLNRVIDYHDRYTKIDYNLKLA